MTPNIRKKERKKELQKLKIKFMKNKKEQHI